MTSAATDASRATPRSIPVRDPRTGLYDAAILAPTASALNNIAERAVRMPKVKQKISGCFRTIVGADNFCTIRSCLDTLRKQGHSMLEVLRRAFAGDPIRPAA